MSEQQYSNNELSSNASMPLLAAERMTEDEARAVIDLWQSRQDASALSSLPSVPDVAEGLGITPQEASRLLLEVREQRQAHDLQRPIETLNDSGVEMGRAIEAGRLAAQREQTNPEQPTQEMREVEALISAERVGNEYLANRFLPGAILAFFLMVLLFIVAIVFVAHLLR